VRGGRKGGREARREEGSVGGKWREGNCGTEAGGRSGWKGCRDWRGGRLEEVWGKRGRRGRKDGGRVRGGNGERRGDR